MPTLMAATVIVIISRGRLRRPNTPTTDKATKIFGIRPIIIALKLLNINKNIKAITANTIDMEPI